MEIFTKRLLQEICIRGCTIVAPNELFTADIPKCLVHIKDNFPSTYFDIFSTISEDEYIEMSVQDYRNDPFSYPSRYPSIGYEIKTIVWYKTMVGLIKNSFYMRCDLNRFQYDLEIVDRLIWDLYNESIFSYSNYAYRTQKYKQIVKDKMLQEMNKSYLLKFMYLGNLLFISELKMTIIDYLIKLDKWHNLEVYE